MPSSPYHITSNNWNNVVSPVYTVFIINCWYSKIPGAALELWQLKLKQFSPDILKFSTKHEDNPFTLNCFMVPRTFLFIFDAGSHRLGSNNFWNWSYKEKTTGSARVSRLSFRFLWLCFHAINAIRKIQHIKSSTAKVYQYLKKLDKNREDAHFKSTLESFVKNSYFVV